VVVVYREAIGVVLCSFPLSQISLRRLVDHDGAIVVMIR
jgi:hypothetical protein